MDEDEDNKQAPMENDGNQASTVDKKRNRRRYIQDDNNLDDILNSSKFHWYVIVLLVINLLDPPFSLPLLFYASNIQAR